MLRRFTREPHKSSSTPKRQKQTQQKVLLKPVPVSATRRTVTGFGFKKPMSEAKRRKLEAQLLRRHTSRDVFCSKETLIPSTKKYPFVVESEVPFAADVLSRKRKKKVIRWMLFLSRLEHFAKKRNVQFVTVLLVLLQHLGIRSIPQHVFFNERDAKWMFACLCVIHKKGVPKNKTIQEEASPHVKSVRKIYWNLVNISYTPHGSMYPRMCEIFTMSHGKG